MPTPIEPKSHRNDGMSRAGIAGILVVQAVILLVIAAAAHRNPAVGSWISDAARAEFVSADPPSASAALPPRQFSSVSHTSGTD